MDDSSPYEPVAPNRHPDAFRLASISSGTAGLIWTLSYEWKYDENMHSGDGAMDVLWWIAASRLMRLCRIPPVNCPEWIGCFSFDLSWDLRWLLTIYSHSITPHFPSYRFSFQFDFLFGLLIKQPSTHQGSYTLLFNLRTIAVMRSLINADLIIKHSHNGQCSAEEQVTQ